MSLSVCPYLKRGYHVFSVDLAGTLTALVLYRNGKRFSAAVTIAGLALALVVEHAWLLTYAR